MPQLIGLILVAVLIKLLIDNIIPAFRKNKSSQSGDFIDISEKWINTDNLPYQKNDYLLNNKELPIFQLINGILDQSRYSVYPHLRLADLLKVPASTVNRQEYLFRIKERSLDMVILESAFLKPILVINLQSSGNGKRQQIADQFTTNALSSAGINSMDIDLNNPPSQPDLLSRLQELGLDLG